MPGNPQKKLRFSIAWGKTLWLVWSAAEGVFQSLQVSQVVDLAAFDVGRFGFSVHGKEHFEMYHVGS